MSIGAVALWASDYAPAILRTKDLFSIRGYGESDDESGQKEEFLGIKPRKDEYISGKYSEEEQKMIDELRSRDQEVRNHEQAHISAGGAYVRGGASYTYQGGPDGKQYAIGGEVSIDSSPVKENPEATIAKMQAVRAAALAPASPSGQDRAVAAAASQAEAQARIEKREKDAERAVSAYTGYHKQSGTSTINFTA